VLASFDQLLVQPAQVFFSQLVLIDELQGLPDSGGGTPTQRHELKAQDKGVTGQGEPKGDHEWSFHLVRTTKPVT
jgi:hypothetical protein